MTHRWAFIFLVFNENLHVQKIHDKDFLLLLGVHLRKIRLSKKITQEDLGFAVGNSGKQIGRIERGENNVTICMLLKIANSLEISLSELVDFNYKK